MFVSLLMGSGSSKNTKSDENRTNNSGGKTEPPSAASSKQPVHSVQVPPAENKLQVKADNSTSKSVTKEEKIGSVPVMEDKKKDAPSNDIQASDHTIVDKGGQAKPLESVLVDEVAVIDEGPKEQLKFDCALNLACLLIKPESLYKSVTKNVTKLQLNRALPLHFALPDLLNRLENLKDLDLSFNNMGPQGLRAVCLAMCNNTSILSLNLSDNKADTDSADCIGKMLEENSTLQYLDVSSNYLGKDYFSRKVGPALKSNTTLKTLRFESIGSTDVRMLIEGLQANTSLVELNFSNNDISDKQGFGTGLAACLKRPECVLSTLSLSRCDLNSIAVTEIERGLRENKSLTELNLTGAQVDSLGVLVSVIITAVKHPCLRNLCLDSVKSKSQDLKIQDEAPCEDISNLQVLSLNTCNLVDGVFTALEKVCQGRLCSLLEVDLTSNENLSLQCLSSLAKMTATEEDTSCLRKLQYGANKGDNLADKLKELPNLQYLNVRLCSMSHESLCQLGLYISSDSSRISTVIMDGLKISGTETLKHLLGNAKVNKLTAVSFGGCSLDDNDLSPLCEAIGSGLQLTMLKVSANRITDEGVAKLVEAVLKSKAPPLAVLDLSNNRIENAGAKSLTKLCTSKSKLHSLNVSANNIGKEGLLALMSVVGGKSSLQSLHVQSQSVHQDERDMVDVFTKLANSLGYKVQYDGDKVKPGCSDLPPNLPDGVMVSATDLGGHSGSVGQALDSRCIHTDFVSDRLPSLAFSHIMQICSFLKGKKEARCVWSEKEWNMITGADRPTTDAPSWLKLSDERDRCVYISNLPGNATLQKVEALLEMEADCSVDETCLLKDPVTRGINGVGWSLMSDQESVTKALNFFNSGEAKIFGQAFMISEVKVQVDNEASAEIERKAAEEKVLRSKLRAKEDAAHRTLIINTTEASWKRHAYRLAHPAYADGRIW